MVTAAGAGGTGDAKETIRAAATVMDMKGTLTRMVGNSGEAGRIALMIICGCPGVNLFG